jgi:hypothetical protein
LIFEKSGAWKGSVLGLAKGLDAGSPATLDADAFFCAAKALAGTIASPTAALVNKSVRSIQISLQIRMLRQMSGTPLTSA